MEYTSEQSIIYRGDGKGRWIRTIWKTQCHEKDVFDLHCQSVAGHMGCHWTYKPDGSYAYWRNESDPDSIDADIGGGWIPPGHDSYVHPVDKRKDYYMAQHSSSEVIDDKIIQALEEGNPPEEQASIDTPIPPEEVARLKEEGTLDDD